MARGVPVYLEVGSKKTFACAVDWPGWTRPARTEEEALETLAAYADRYEAVAAAAGLKLPAAATRGALDVVARLKGGATTDFGAPGVIPDFDADRPTPAEWQRQIALLRGCWQAFDGVVAGAPPHLTKGPRGGGRDRDQIAAHVLEGEAGYARMIGTKVTAPDPADASGIANTRDELVTRLNELRKTGPTPGPRGGKRWPAPYAVRRLAWHVTDHMWEIEDKTPKP